MSQEEPSQVWHDSVEIKDTDVLLIIDVQNDFVPGGALAVAEGDIIIKPISELASKFREQGSRIVMSQDWHPQGHLSFASEHDGKNPFDPIEGIEGIGPVLWPDHCMQGSKGAEFHGDMDSDLAHLIVRKGFNPKIDSYSAFEENDKKTQTGLGGYLKTIGTKRVFVCGLALDYCVYYSALGSVNNGFETMVIHDLTRGIAPESVESSMQDMARNNISFVNSDAF